MICPTGDFPYNPLQQQGWQCPVCKSVMSPNTPICWRCSLKENKIPDNFSQPLTETLQRCKHGILLKFNTCSECSGYTLKICDHDWDHDWDHILLSDPPPLRCIKCNEIKSIANASPK